MAALAPKISRPKPGTPRNFTESLTEKAATLMLTNRVVIKREGAGEHKYVSFYGTNEARSLIVKVHSEPDL